MAIVVPIVSQWNGKGLQKAVREFKSLDGVAAKTGFVLKKAAMGASVGFAALATAGVGVATALFGAARAADADRKSQINLAKTAQQFAHANDAQVKGLESTIKSLMLATGVADDDLRPAMSRLLRSTKDVTKAQRLLRLAMDISGRTGADLNDVVEALGKGADGATRGLQKLGIGFTKAELKGKSLDDIVAMLEGRFKGGAADAADTLEGRMARLKTRLSELWEEIGYKVLPFFEKMASAAIRLIDAFDQGGVAGAMQEFKRGMEQMRFEGSPIAIFFENFYTAIKTVHDALTNLHNFTVTVTGMRAVGWAVGKATGKPNPIQNLSQMPAWGDIFSRVPNAPSMRPGTVPGRNPWGSQNAPNIVVNVTTNDPQVIVDRLRQASRQQNGLTGIRIR